MAQWESRLKVLDLAREVRESCLRKSRLCWKRRSRHGLGEREGKHFLGKRDRKYKSPEAGGSRTSNGNWKKARWLLLGQSGMTCCHVVYWSTLMPASETRFRIFLPKTTLGVVKFIAWNWPRWMYSCHKNQPALSPHPPPESQFTSTPLDCIM